MSKVNIVIDGVAVKVPKDATILEAARLANIKIPTLCYLKEINKIGACRVCMVQVGDNPWNLSAACVAGVWDGMQVHTGTERAVKARKTTLELLLSTHSNDCLSCVRSKNCELQTFAAEYQTEEDKYAGAKLVFEKDATQWLVRDNNKCITCRKCVAACKERQAVNVIGANERGFATLIGSAFDKPLAEIPCIACGQCIVVCPTGALTEKCDIEPVVAALNDPTKYVVIAPAPSIRVALGEEFGMRVGENVEGRMVEALRRLGANAVYDINWAADLTIMEEGHEFIGRLQKHKEGKPVKFPMITSCSPGWIKFIEMYYPEHLEHLSTCKSPQGMFGAIMKSYYAQQNKINLKDLVVVTVMPCTAKKFEAARKELTTKDGYPEVDYVLTTRELARLIKSRGIDFPKLKGDVKKEGKFDQPFGESSTAGLIFGATGGVMEAALRTVVEKITGKPVKPLEVKDVRGPKKGIKEAKYRIPELASKFGIDELKVAVVHGTQNAKTIMEKIKKGEADYHLVEIMACPGGCVTGGGQPIHTAEYMNNHDLRDQRAKAIYATDKKGKVRESHKNKSVEQLYKDFLGEPSGKKAYELLHTKFQKRTKH